MLNWLSGSRGKDAPGIERLHAEFGQMLDAGRHIFDAAANAFLGGTDPEVIRGDLFETDKRINLAEQQIRREIIVHATVHGANVFPHCLVLMSAAKDAERVGDYAKNIFDLAELCPTPPEGPYKDDLIHLKDRISRLMAAARESFDRQDREAAQALIRDSQGIEDHCDAKLSQLIRTDQNIELAPVYALAYRYFKRVASHIFNVATTVVQPVDKIDFSDKPAAEERGAAARGA